ncbi:MAG: hypothetical protein HQ518_25790 [Rhodopirellula sp.]|nr:hypothetical protein [Rhodopirellula sp.]
MAQPVETTAEFKYRLLNADPMPVLDDRELARLKAIMPKMPLSDLRRANTLGEHVPAVEEFKKLKQIRDFNRQLRHSRGGGKPD